MQYNDVSLCTLEINALMVHVKMDENNAFFFQGINMYWMQLRSSQNLVTYEFLNLCTRPS